MTKPIAASYQLAQDLIASGVWRVEPDLGQIINTLGVPFKRLNSWGYIQIKMRRPGDWRREATVLAHRVIWEAVHGPTPAELEINHRNGVKADNRIVNLELVTHLQNVRHARATGLTPVMAGEQQPQSRLTDDQVRAIYARTWRTDENQQRIAADYGVTRSIISNIKRGWAWTHVTHHEPGSERPSPTVTTS